MPSVSRNPQLFDKVFGEFDITVPFVKAMGVSPPAVAMYFDPVAVPFTREPRYVVLQLVTDALASGAVRHRKIADARKIATEG